LGIVDLSLGSGSRFGFGSAAHATNSERINNRQSNRIVKNSFALAAYTDLSTQEMNDLSDLTSRFRSRARSIIWSK
jgi:ATP-dependent protease HslVU (ClpYQ) peptidase subunit